MFGCFVAFSQWLVPYFVNVYYLPLVTAGIFASMFSLPSGVIRALGGWMSDKFGGRSVMYWVLGASVVISFLVIIPKMDVYSPGRGVMAKRPGIITDVSGNSIVVDAKSYSYKVKPDPLENFDEKMLILPSKQADLAGTGG